MCKSRTLANRLRWAMSVTETSQKQLAEAAGVTSSAVSSTLAGKTVPGVRIIKGMARVMPQISIDWVLSGRL